MNAREAREARNARGVKSTYEQEREDPAMAQRIDRYLAEIELEQQFIDAMEDQQVTASELARRVSAKRATVSRDLHGGLSEAKLGRVRRLADAIGYDVVTLLVPRDPELRKKVVTKVARELAGRSEA